VQQHVFGNKDLVGNLLCAQLTCELSAIATFLVICAADYASPYLTLPYVRTGSYSEDVSADPQYIPDTILGQVLENCKRIMRHFHFHKVSSKMDYLANVLVQHLPKD